MKARHQKLGKENPIHLWALSYCAKNRVKSAHLRNEGHCLARDISIDKFLANDADVKMIKQRTSYIIQNHIAMYIPIFMHLKGQVDKHQLHGFILRWFKWPGKGNNVLPEKRFPIQKCNTGPHQYFQSCLRLPSLYYRWLLCVSSHAVIKSTRTERAISIRL